MNILLLIATLLKIVPLVMEMIRDGKIKEATTNEVLAAFEAEFGKRWNERIARAKAAGDAASSDSDSGGSGVRDTKDPLDRANARRSTGGKGEK